MILWKWVRSAVNRLSMKNGNFIIQRFFIETVNTNESIQPKWKETSANSSAPRGVVGVCRENCQKYIKIIFDMRLRTEAVMYNKI